MANEAGYLFRNLLKRLVSSIGFADRGVHLFGYSPCQAAQLGRLAGCKGRISDDAAFAQTLALRFAQAEAGENVLGVLT